MSIIQSDFPILYHTHHSLHSQDIPFWLDLAARQGNPILELGCGTGRVLIPLAQAGYAVTGLDNDQAMLTLLLRKLPLERSRTIRIFQADMTRFRLEQNFALILLPCNTYSTLDSVRRRALLARVRGHLRPEGLFAVSVPNPTLLSNLPAHGEPEVEDIFPHPRDGEPVQVSSEWQRSKRIFTLIWHYDHLLPDGQVERLTARALHYLVPVVSYLEELRAAGLGSVKMFGDFNRSPYREDSMDLILEAG